MARDCGPPRWCTLSFYERDCFATLFANTCARLPPDAWSICCRPDGDSDDNPQDSKLRRILKFEPPAQAREPVVDLYWSFGARVPFLRAVDRAWRWKRKEVRAQGKCNNERRNKSERASRSDVSRPQSMEDEPGWEADDDETKQPDQEGANKHYERDRQNVRGTDKDITKVYPRNDIKSRDR